MIFISKQPLRLGCPIHRSLIAVGGKARFVLALTALLSPLAAHAKDFSAISMTSILLTRAPCSLSPMNWNPSYSYATIPAGLTGYPSYSKTLTTVVPAEQGIARVHDLHIWNIHATGAKTAFEVDAYQNAPVYNVKLDHLDIQAQTAGHIFDAKDWVFSDTKLTTADGSVVSLSDDANITGIASRPAPPNQPKPDSAKKSFAERDKS